MALKICIMYGKLQISESILLHPLILFNRILCVKFFSFRIFFSLTVSKSLEMISFWLVEPLFSGFMDFFNHPIYISARQLWGEDFQKENFSLMKADQSQFV